MDIILCLKQINPNVGWSVNANDYNQITCSNPQIPIPTLAELEAAWVEVNKGLTKTSLTNAVQTHLDTTAQGKGYDGILSASSYASSVNPFQTEGIAFLEWRSACWTKCYQILDDVEKGLRPVPTEAELIDELPEFTIRQPK